jgi:predicted nucleic acid-binding protein
VIILDTNVLSELMRPAPSPAVTRWVGARPSTSLYTTSVTEAELLHGLGLLPPGRRRSALEAAARGILDLDLGGRVLPFGRDAARAFAAVALARRRSGRPISQLDAQIAAIALAADATLATRNIADLEDCGVELVDPFHP